jgi:hypothetical protein
VCVAVESTLPRCSASVVQRFLVPRLSASVLGDGQQWEAHCSVVQQGSTQQWEAHCSVVQQGSIQQWEAHCSVVQQGSIQQVLPWLLPRASVSRPVHSQATLKWGEAGQCCCCCMECQKCSVWTVLQSYGYCSLVQKSQSDQALL